MTSSGIQVHQLRSRTANFSAAAVLHLQIDDLRLAGQVHEGEPVGVRRLDL